MSHAVPPTQRFAPLSETITSAPSKAELEILAFWEREKTFERLQESRRGKPAFVFWEGPPTANGRPGIHHVLARTLKDTVCRFQTMLGHRVERKAGWDTHGLPVELEVEKSLGISGKPQIEKYGVAAFNQKCRESVWKYREEWEKLSARIGYWLDYADPYVTYEANYVESVWYLLARFHRAGLIYRGKRVLPYCGRCGTGLSSHELGQPGVYRDVMDPSVIVRCRGWIRPQASSVDQPSSDAIAVDFLVWTTTPWTLPSNVAIAVHPDRQYVAARQLKHSPTQTATWCEDDRLVCLVKERASAVLGVEGEHFEIVHSFVGRQLVESVYDRLFDVDGAEIEPGAWQPSGHTAAEPARQVVAAEYVTVDDGTGIVHQAPAYGADDWATAQRHKLFVLQAVGAEGKFVVDVGPVKAGTFFKDADDALMDDLKARGLVFKKSRESHSYPHCWRCNTALFYFASPAWYIRTTALKERMVAFNKRIRWVPEDVGTGRFGEWLENNVDWNISRDRYWGTPLPFWICDGCDHETAIESVDELARLAGALPKDFDLHKPAVDAPRIPCAKCCGSMRRTAPVLDCWFDSGAMPFAQYHWPFGTSRATVADQFPASFICEGLDQTRGWFYTLHAIGAFVTTLPDAGLADAPAYGTCLVNGLVLDKDGVKMSKRLGNVVDPWKVIEEHGTDAVRWYLISSAAPWLPKKFDPEGLAETRGRFFRALVNSYQFFREYARIDAFDPAASEIPPVAARPEIDRWLVSRTQSVCTDVRAAMERYDLTAATRAIESFVVDELSNWYIRRNRRRFWKGESGADKLAAYATLHDALTKTALVLAPFAPFLSEMLWQRLAPGLGSVHVQLFPTPRAEFVDRDLEGGMRLVERLVVMGRALREKAGMRTRQPLRAIHVRASDSEALRLLATPFAAAQVLDELNIKQVGSLAADDGKLVKLVGKANFKVLGKKIGARMKAAAAAIGGLDAAALSTLRSGGHVSVEVEGAPLELVPEDVLVSVESRADFAVETDGHFVVWLDTALDRELVREGLAREAVNRINGLRKERELEVEDRIRLTLYSADADVRAAVGEARREGGFRELVAAETLATGLALADSEPAGAEVASWDLGEGRTLVARLERAG
ncbi:MAG: isoleucine--tRNA ligase [Planctomycetes bacterium]|nr:isoleucine--tRNA ligase [Planctomycetota bacterium]